MSRVENAKKNIIWGIVNKIINIFMPFVVRTAIIYVIGSGYLGLDGLFTSILQVINIAELGISSAIVYSMYKPLSEGKIDDICALLNLYKNTYRVIGVITLIFGIIIMPFIPNLINGNIPDDVNIYTLFSIFLLNTVLGYFMFSYRKSLLSACQREDIVNKVNSLVVLIRTLIQILILLVYKKYYFFIIIMPVMTALDNIVSACLSCKYYPEYKPRGSINPQLLSDIKKRIKGLFIQRICAASRNSFDNIAISMYVGLSMVTIYGNYYYVVAAASSILNSIPKSMAATVGNAVAEKSVSSNYEDMIIINFIYMWAVSFCTICMACTYQTFMNLWVGRNMLLPTHIMFLFCCYYYALSMGEVRSIYYAASGLWWEGRWRSIIEALSNCVLNFALGKTLGVLGIVLATLFSIVVINFGYGSSIIHKFYFAGISKKYFYIQHVYYAFATFVAVIACYAICSKYNGNNCVKLVLSFIVCCVVGNGILFILYRKLRVFNKSKLFIHQILYSNRK